MKILKKLMLVAFAGALLAACSKDLETVDPVVDPIGEESGIGGPKKTVTFGLAASDMTTPGIGMTLLDTRAEDADEAISFGLQPDTRATEPATADEKTLVSVMILQFNEENDNAELVETQFFTKAAGQIGNDNSVSVALYELPKTTIYAIVNIPKAQIESSITLTLKGSTAGTKLSAFKAAALQLSEVKSTELTTKGLPMIGSCTSADFTNETATIPVSFMVSKIKLKVAVNMQKGSFTATSAELRDVLKTVPVAAPASTATSTGTSVFATYAKMACTNTSELTFYVPENIRGNITNSEAKKKSWWTAPRYASYIVITGNYTTDSGANTYTVEYSIFPGTNETSNFDIKRNTIYTISPTIRGTNEKDFRIAYAGYAGVTHDPNLCKDLVNGSAATANCYMVNRPLATYMFDARVMGNGNTSIPQYSSPAGVTPAQTAPALNSSRIKPLTPNSVKTLWETGTTTPGAVIRAVKLVDGYVYFSTGSDFDRGVAEANALIAVYSGATVPANPETGVLWSWHIWSTAWTPATQSYQGKSSRTINVMNRNLGAAHNNVATNADNGSFGLLYQWGRKDPFVGAATASSASNGDASNPGQFATNTKGNNWTSTTGSGTPEEIIASAISQPTTFFKQVDPTRYDWVGGTSYTNQRDNLWGAPNTNTAAPTPSTCNASSLARTAKSPYDPCPAGYMVAPQDTWLNFTKKKNASDTFVPGSNTSDSGQFNVNGTFNVGWNFIYSGTNTVYYPAAGYRNATTAALTSVGTSGYAWSSSSYYAGSYDVGFLSFGSTGVHPLGNTWRAHGMPVRCVQNQ